MKMERQRGRERREGEGEGKCKQRREEKDNLGEEGKDTKRKEGARIGHYLLYMHQRSLKRN